MAKPLKTKQVPAEFLINFYDAYLREDGDANVAKKLDVTSKTLRDRVAKYPDLQLAKKLAQERKAGNATLSNYVYKRLSNDAQKTWSEIQFWHDESTSYDRLEAILAGKSEKLRQELFIHALVCNSFDISTACYQTNTSRLKLNQWKTDLAFRQLVEEIQLNKEDFFEKALVDLAGQGNPAAVIFANKTLNGKRGYNEKLTVEHTGGINIGLNFEDLILPIEVKRVVLQAIKDYEKSQPIDVQTEQKLLGDG